MLKMMRWVLPLALVYGGVVWLAQPGAGRDASAVGDDIVPVSGFAQQQGAGLETNHPGVGRPSFMSPHAGPIAVRGGFVYVANTPADTVDVLDAATGAVVARVSVGVDPVGLAVRPDGSELWVSNHVSDSVSVIDLDASSATYRCVVATVQDFDARTRATRFDEPVGIAFADDTKAYVALSSENVVAVVDVATRRVTGRLRIPAQDPRAIAVRDGRLYVLPFESNNQTQLSGGVGDLDGELETFDAFEHAVANNNVLSIGAVQDIVKHPRVPDRDLFVFDTSTDRLVGSVDTLGTLLYGLAVGASGEVFIAQADARNDANGRAGTAGHGLKELENRAFLNQITRVRVGVGDVEEAVAERLELEPLPPEHPGPGEALATPYAVALASEGRTIVATAAGSDLLFTVDAERGEVLGRVGVGAVPRGVAVEQGRDAGVERAWVLNAVDNSVSCVDVSDPARPRVVTTVALEDPTHPAVKRGRIAFNSASASTTQTFSCASCHPDGHTDQLLWVLETPVVSMGDQIMPRSTMPVRGLRDTAPFHWDGIPGDPYGGNNSANVFGHDAPNCDPDDPTSAARHLIDGGLANTMRAVDADDMNDEGKPGSLSAQQRDDMAAFLLAVPYPPAQRRAYDNVVSDRARRGFELFHIHGDNDPKLPQPNVCGDCHRMPFLVSTNTPGNGMDAPTWRGAYDRYLILPQGRLNIIGLDFYERVARAGNSERSIWQFSWAGRPRFDPVWDMVLEGSTGFDGAFARQVTLSEATADDDLTIDLLNALERSAAQGGTLLRGEGVLVGVGGDPMHIELRFDAGVGDGGSYVEADGATGYTRASLMRMASEGMFVGTFTARIGEHSDYDHPQPAIWTRGPIHEQRGRQQFPVLHPGERSMTVSGRHLMPGATVHVDGERVAGEVITHPGEDVTITLAELPEVGMHLLQVQNPDGLFSNDFIFHVVQDAGAADRRPVDSGDRNAVLGEQLREKVEAGVLTRDEAVALYVATFPDDAPADATTDDPVRDEHRLLAREQGRFGLDLRIDLAVIGNPGVIHETTGTVEAQTIQGGRLLLSRSQVDGSETLSFTGYNPGDAMYFNLSFDPSRPAIGYMQGAFGRDGRRRLDDPFSELYVVTAFDGDAASVATLYNGGDPRELVRSTLTRWPDEDGETAAPLEAMLNTTNDENAPADLAELRRLAAFVGDFTAATEPGHAAAWVPEGGGIVRARLVGNGRFLLAVHAKDNDSLSEGVLTLTSYDTGRRLYQHVLLDPRRSAFAYFEGRFNDDGHLVLTTPGAVAPTRRRTYIAEDGGGYRVVDHAGYNRDFPHDLPPTTTHATPLESRRSR